MIWRSSSAPPRHPKPSRSRPSRHSKCASHLGEDVPEIDVRTALKTGDLGFLHSFTTGSAVDGPGIRLVAWTTSCMFRCQYCHNPDTWTLRNGIPVTLDLAIDEVRKYANGLMAMNGGFTLSGGEPLMQDRFAARLFAAVKAMGVHTAHRDERLLRRQAVGRRDPDHRPRDPRHEGFHARSAQARHRHCTTRRCSISAAASRRLDGRCGCATCWSPA